MNIFAQNNQPTEMDIVMGNIANVENEIQQKVYQLGRAYYEDNRGNAQAGNKYYPMIDMINKLEQNKEEYFKAKLRMEGKMKCTSCGTIIPYGSRFCSMCGQKLEEKQPGTAPEQNKQPEGGTAG